MRLKLTLLAVLSSLALWTAPLSAHEVTPVIADLTVEGGAARLDLRMNAEAFVAGIDLGSVLDTASAEEAARYDALRALPPGAMADAVRGWAAGWLEGLDLRAEGAPLALRLEEVTVPEVGEVG